MIVVRKRKLTSQKRGQVLNIEFCFIKLRKSVADEGVYIRNQVTLRNGRTLDLGSLLTVARVQEMGVEDEFFGNEDFDQARVDALDPEEIEFFRLYIRGAKNYLQNHQQQ